MTRARPSRPGGVRCPGRRDFLIGSVAATASLLPASRSLASLVSQPAADLPASTDVIVIGAGLAGLTAARELSEAGKRVVVLEASSRVGGRTWSVPFSDAGVQVDLGAEWVTPHWHTAMVAELQRYRIPLAWDHEEVPEEGAESSFSASFVEAMARCDRDASLIRFDTPDWYRDALQFDISMTEYVAAMELDQETEALLLANAFALMGSHHDEYSAINLLHEIAGYGSSRAAFGADSARITGGADALASSMANELGDRVYLGWPVASIEAGSSGVAVSGPRGRVTAPSAVVALPVNVLPDVDLHLPLSAASRQAIEEGHAGRAAKGWAAVEAGVEVDSMGWPDAVEAYTVQGENAAVLASFGIGVPDAHSALQRAWSSVRERHPELSFRGRYLSHDWHAFPYSRGTWACPRPGQQKGWHDLADTPPPCVFAGGDLSRRWFGWMEGAVTSGRDAAARLLLYLEGKDAPRAIG